MIALRILGYLGLSLLLISVLITIKSVVALFCHRTRRPSWPAHRHLILPGQSMYDRVAAHQSRSGIRGSVNALVNLNPSWTRHLWRWRVRWVTGPAGIELGHGDPTVWIPWMVRFPGRTCTEHKP